MTMEQASVWLSGSILIMLGIIIIAGGIIVVNNLLHRYWKPVTIFSKDSWSMFGGPLNNDPINQVTDSEYAKLVDYLNEIRNPTTKVKKEKTDVNS